MNPFAQIFDILIGIYITIILLRFFLQYFRADFYNPLSQFVVKATDPLVKPLRKVVPGLGGIDVSTMLLAYLVTVFKFLFVFVLMGNVPFDPVIAVLYPVLDLLKSILSLFMFLIIVRIILSWIAPGGYNPILAVIGQISEPLVSKFRKALPKTDGFDLSPMMALLFLLFLFLSIDYWVTPLLFQ